jgi:hypothetical protein
MTSLWRKRKNCDNLAPNVVANVHHNEQKPDHLVNILNKLHDENVRLGLYEGVYDLSIKSEKAMREVQRLGQEIEIEYVLKVEDDNDIQDYKKPWVGLTQDELNMIGDSMRTWNSWTITDVYFAIEAKLKEKNT